MRRLRNFFLLITIGLTVSAISADREHKPLHEHYVYTAEDLIAIADMRSYASTHYGALAEIAGTFGVSEGWDDSWIYRQLRFRLATGESITICHAMNRHDTTLRYASSRDDQSGQYAHWDAVH